MTFSDFVRKSKTEYRQHGKGAIPYILADFSLSALGKLPIVSRIGSNAYDKDWDILVILDACRLDLYHEVVNPESGYIWSVGSSSPEWMDNTFNHTDTSDTTYVTGNVFSRDKVQKSDFLNVEEVWRYGWDDEEGTIPADVMTDVAINEWRSQEEGRMVVHYMQPHFPLIGSEHSFSSKMNVDTFGSGMMDVWDGLKYGEYTREEVWEGYVQNLEYVWQYVSLLMDNVDGKVAVTADHGNSFGEYATFGHAVGKQIPPLRFVPWDVYECRDSQEYIPEEVDERDDVDLTVEERLEVLGYR